MVGGRRHWLSSWTYSLDLEQIFSVQVDLLGGEVLYGNDVAVEEAGLGEDLVVCIVHGCRAKGHRGIVAQALDAEAHLQAKQLWIWYDYISYKFYCDTTCSDVGLLTASLYYIHCGTTTVTLHVQMY